MPASAAMSSRLVAANPARAKARVAAAMICSRRSVRGSRRAAWAPVGGGAASATSAPSTISGSMEFTTQDVHASVYILESTFVGDAVNESIIAVDGLVKVFRGGVRALDGL